MHAFNFPQWNSQVWTKVHSLYCGLTAIGIWDGVVSLKPGWGTLREYRDLMWLCSMWENQCKDFPPTHYSGVNTELNRHVSHSLDTNHRQVHCTLLWLFLESAKGRFGAAPTITWKNTTMRTSDWWWCQFHVTGWAGDTILGTKHSCISKFKTNFFFLFKHTHMYLFH